MNTRSGVTILELLISFSLMVIIVVVSIQGLGGYQRAKNIPLTLNEIATVIQATQKRSITQEQNTRWGIRFANSTSTQPDTYSIFRGASYTPGGIDQPLTLKRNTQFSEPSASSTFDMIFDPVTGFLASTKIISIIDTTNTTGVGDLIVSPLGRVTTRVESGLVGYWHFDEGAGTVAYDASRGEHNGTLISAPTRQSGSACKAGGCLGFDGATTYVSVPSVNPTDAISVSAWARSASASEYSGYWQLVSKYPAYILGSGGGKIICFIIYDTTWEYGSCYDVPDPQAWHHFVGTYDASTREKKLYVDGILRDTTLGTGPLNADPDALFIGRRECCTETFSGTIDEVRIYNRVLSPSEVLSQYNDLK